MSRLIPLVLLAIVLLAACGGGDDTAPPAATCRTDFVGPLSADERQTCPSLQVNPRNCRTSKACL